MAQEGSRGVKSMMKDGKISLDDIEAVLDELYESMAGDSFFYVDGEVIETDTGYAAEGALLLVNMIRNRLE